MGELSFNEYRAFVGDDENVLVIDNCSAYRLWRYLVPLNYTLTNGQNHKYYGYFTTHKKIANQMQQHIKMIYTMAKWGFPPECKVLFF